GRHRLSQRVIVDIPHFEVFEESTAPAIGAHSFVAWRFLAHRLRRFSLRLVADDFADCVPPSNWSSSRPIVDSRSSREHAAATYRSGGTTHTSVDGRAR